MSCAFKDIAAVDQVAVSTPDVTIVMPCLNEMQSLPHWIVQNLKIFKVLAQMHQPILWLRVIVQVVPSTFWLQQKF